MWLGVNSMPGLLFDTDFVGILARPRATRADAVALSIRMPELYFGA